LAIVWLVRAAGTAELAVFMDRLVPFIPVLLLLEALRIGLELLTTRAVLGEHARAVPLRALVRAQLVANSIIMSMPTGRPAGEALKAVLLAPHVGTGRAFAVGVVGQSLTLIVNGIFALCAWLVLPLDLGGASAAAVGGGGGANATTLALALMTMGLVTLSLGGFVQLAARSHRVSRTVGRIERVRMAVERFRSASAELSLVPVRPALLMLCSRGFQVAQFALLLHAFGVGASLEVALVAQGIYLLGAAAGDLVPAQLGVVDGAFALAAPLFGASVSAGVAIAIALHLAQLVWVALGALLGIALRQRAAVAPVPEREPEQRADTGDAIAAAVATPSVPPAAS
jgi:hypothetical protein